MVLLTDIQLFSPILEVGLWFVVDFSLGCFLGFFSVNILL